MNSKTFDFINTNKKSESMMMRKQTTRLNQRRSLVAQLRETVHARFRPMKKHTAISPSLKILNYSVPFPEFCSTHTVRIAQHKSKLNYSLNTVQ